MYKVLKSAGNGNVVVENTDTKASVVIGKLTLDIVSAIKEGGYEVKKPIRDQSKKSKDKLKGKIGVEVDAFDLIFNI